jgi:integrase
MRRRRFTNGDHLSITADHRATRQGTRENAVDRYRRPLVAQPSGETKNRVAHRVWFSDPAWKLLATIPRDSEWVFASPKKSDEPIAWTAKALARMRPSAGVAGFQARDLRRTLATRMAEAGIDPRTVGRILNHKERGIIRVYNRYQFDKEKQQAWALWERKLTRILSNLKAVKA